jgi:serine/threonine protein kinase
MGEVYRARDLRLHRVVALKVLRSDRASDPEHQSRLLREARAASALQHPNIVSIYDILSERGALILVLEYVHGRTLDELIPKEGLRLHQVLAFGLQIADALAAAHAAGVVHRDLKPGNIKVTDQGTVKLLDFGLAKLLAPPAPVQDSDTQTITSVNDAVTEAGLVVGTVAYMSPEQAEGKSVDARSDIFSFGCVLYEMITGHRAFRGNSPASTLSAVLRDEPRSPVSVCSEVPRDVDKMVLRCLRKDRNRRWQTVSDLRIELEDLKQESDSGTLTPTVVPPSRSRGTRDATLVAAAVVTTGVLLAALWWTIGPHTKLLPVTLKPVPLTSNPGIEQYPTFSPDGNQLAFAWSGAQQQNFDINVKVIGAGDALRLTTEGDISANFSYHAHPRARRCRAKADRNRDSTNFGTRISSISPAHMVAGQPLAHHGGTGE